MGDEYSYTDGGDLNPEEGGRVGVEAAEEGAFAGAADPYAEGANVMFNAADPYVAGSNATLNAADPYVAGSNASLNAADEGETATSGAGGGGEIDEYGRPIRGEIDEYGRRIGSGLDGGDGGDAAPGRYRTKALDPAFAHEDDRDHPDNIWAGAKRPGMSDVVADQTAYLDDDEQRRYGLSFGADGKAYQMGAELDTTESRKPLVAGSKAGRQIFTMDEEGRMSAANPEAEMDDRPGERFHHSSLAAGEAVAGAGEIQTRDGTVELISDRSGHYRPDMTYTEQVLDSLDEHGVRIEAVGVELEAKPGMAGEIKATGTEVMSYADVTPAELSRTRTGLDAADADEDDVRDTPRSHEQLLRERHGQKDDMLSELKRRTAGRKEAADQGVAADALLEDDPLRDDDIVNDAAPAQFSGYGRPDADDAVVRPAAAYGAPDADEATGRPASAYGGPAGAGA